MTAASNSDARKRNAAQVDPVEVVDVAELMARLERVAKNLDALSYGADVDRLRGKASGVRLALSYVRDMKREATS